MKKTLKTRKIYDGITILENRYLKNDPEMAQLVAEKFNKLQIGQKLYNLRTKAKLTQRELAYKINTSASNISRIETANYNGDGSKILKSVTAVLNKTVKSAKIRLVRKQQSPKNHIKQSTHVNKKLG